jgi:hypothetical protein
LKCQHLSQLPRIEKKQNYITKTDNKIIALPKKFVNKNLPAFVIAVFPDQELVSFTRIIIQ